jgi:hypothetical protein
MNDFYRMVCVVGYRMSIAQLFVNEIYYGVYLIVEETDDTFIKDHWEVYTGNYYKVGAGEYMSNISEPHERVRMKGNDNWTSWDYLVGRLTSSNMTTAEFESLFNVDRLIRGMILDIFSLMTDGYIQNGNNYGFYANPETGLMDYTTRDYETALYHSVNDGIFANHYVHKSEYSQILFLRIVKDPLLLPRYIKTFKAFLTQAFNAKSQQNMWTRTSVYGTIIANQLRNDAFYNLEGARTGDIAQDWVDALLVWLPARAKACADYLNLTWPL